MGAFGNFSLPPAGGYGGGIPQYFTRPGQQNTWFPGAPQFNTTLGGMVSDFSSLDPELQQLMGGLNAYGAGSQREALASGRMAATSAADIAAKGQGTADAAQAAEAAQGFGGQAGLGEDVNYASAMEGTNIRRAEGKAAASQVPGQIALAKQQIRNQYRIGQLKNLKSMIDLISSAAGSNYGYQGAQLSADRGQISLANAQNAEQAQNLASLFNVIEHGPIAALSPSTFYGGGGEGGGGSIQDLLKAWGLGGLGGSAGGPDLGFGSQMGSLTDAGMGSGQGMGAMLQTMGMA